MVEEIEIQKVDILVLIQVDKGEVQSPTYTIILQNIISLFTRRNIIRSCQMLRKKFNGIERLMPAVL